MPKYSYPSLTLDKKKILLPMDPHGISLLCCDISRLPSSEFWLL